MVGSNAMKERESATEIGKYSRLGNLGVCVCVLHIHMRVGTHKGPRSSTVTLQEPFALFLR